MPRIDPQNPTVELLLSAYAQGAFPMADPDSGDLEWFSPEQRGIIPLEPSEFRVPHSLAREMRKRPFEITADRAFERVMRECATDRSDWNRSWIDERLIRAYTALHKAGFAHSLEAWRDGALVGGLYGVHIGAAFFGESMFSRPAIGGTNASKIGLVHLVRWLHERGFTLLDVQFPNPHLAQFGCRAISREQYMRELAAAVARQGKVTWGKFRPAEK